jgi:hypothetical protein
MARRRIPTYQEQLKEGLDEIASYGSYGGPAPAPPHVVGRPESPAVTIEGGVDEKQAKEAQEVWTVLGMTRADSPAKRLRDHEGALRALEHEKLNRLQLMTWAQQIRARFLSLSMADRKLFLGVLTADTFGSFTKLFELQAEVQSAGITDEKLKLFDTAVKHGLAGTEKSIVSVKRRIRQQEENRGARETIKLNSRQRALPPATLSLPGVPPLQRGCQSCGGLFSCTEQHATCKRCRGSNQTYEANRRKTK